MNRFGEKRVVAVRKVSILSMFSTEVTFAVEGGIRELFFIMGGGA